MIPLFALLNSLLLLTLTNSFVIQGPVTRPMTTAHFGSVLSDASLHSDYFIDGSALSTSGKAAIHSGYRKCPLTGERCGHPLIIKSSTNIQAVLRELENYRKVSNNDAFVQIWDSLIPKDSQVYFATTAAIVMEKGECDLLDFLRDNGPMEGEKLREAATQVAKCVKVVHDSEMVWTEVKSENFVICSGAIKGIDLESAVPLGSSVIDFTPKTCPPEFALGFLDGRPKQDEMAFDYDVWSLGTVYYEMATGELFHDKKHILEVAQIIMDLTQSDLDAFLYRKIADPVFRDLIGACLSLDRSRRPTINEVLNHPFIVSSFSHRQSTTSIQSGSHLDALTTQYMADLKGAANDPLTSLENPTRQSYSTAFFNP